MPDMGDQYIWTDMESFGDLTASIGTSMTLGNSDAKGSYAQLIASTTFDYAAVILEFLSNSSLDRRSIDFAIGAGGSEKIILPNYLIGGNTSDAYRSFFLPISIPAATRLSIRGQTSLTTGTNTVRFIGHGIAANPRMPVPQAAYAIVYGFTGATTIGVSIDPGATANTKGAWVQVSASTSQHHCGLLLAVTTNNNGTTTGTTIAVTQQWLIDIGVGANGSEKVIVPNIPVRVTTGRIVFTTMLWFPVAIPTSTRLSVRCQCSVNTATERIADVTLYGLV